MEGWRELRNAIILRAIDDWRMLVNRQTTPKSNCNYDEIEQFLSSKWCSELMVDMNIDGKDVLKILQEYKRTRIKKNPKNPKPEEEITSKIQFFNGWNRDRIKHFIADHVSMKKDTYTDDIENGYRHEFADGQTYELRLGDFLRHQPTEIYINGELAQRHQH